jgi:ferredoxin
MKKKVKIIYNREGCIGAGVCWTVAPKFFITGADNKADLVEGKLNPETGKYERIVEVDEEELKQLKETAEGCPVFVIEVIEE